LGNLSFWNAVEGRPGLPAELSRFWKPLVLAQTTLFSFKYLKAGT
jgi:hypothetical protein